MAVEHWHLYFQASPVGSGGRTFLVSDQSARGRRRLFYVQSLTGFWVDERQLAHAVKRGAKLGLVGVASRIRRNRAERRRLRAAQKAGGTATRLTGWSVEATRYFLEELRLARSPGDEQADDEAADSEGSDAEAEAGDTEDNEPEGSEGETTMKRTLKSTAAHATDDAQATSQAPGVTTPAAPGASVRVKKAPAAKAAKKAPAARAAKSSGGKAAATKKASPKKAAAEVARGVDDDKAVTKVAKENPSREGTVLNEAWGYIKGGQTLGANIASVAEKLKVTVPRARGIIRYFEGRKDLRIG